MMSFPIWHLFKKKVILCNLSNFTDCATGYFITKMRRTSPKTHARAHIFLPLHVSRCIFLFRVWGRLQTLPHIWNRRADPEPRSHLVFCRRTAPSCYRRAVRSFPAGSCLLAPPHFLNFSITFRICPEWISLDPYEWNKKYFKLSLGYNGALLGQTNNWHKLD